MALQPVSRRAARRRPQRRRGRAADQSGISAPAAISLALAAALGFVFVVVGLRRQPSPVASEPTAAPAAEPAPPSPPLFDAWLAFEPPETARNEALAGEYVDVVLGHQVFQFPPQGLPPYQARELLLDDDKMLFSSGRRLWNHELLHQPGMAGKFCFLHSTFCAKRLFDVQFFVDGNPAVIYDNLYRIERYPSHTHVTYALGGVRVEEYKFITYDDRAVAVYEAVSADQKPHRVDVEALASYWPMPNSKGEPDFPLLGSGTYQGSGVYVYLDAPGFRKADSHAIVLQKMLEVPANGTAVSAAVAISFEDRERTAGMPALTFEGALARQKREYNAWFADNVPYFDAPDPGFKRMWYYRWWIVRFNMTQADTPDLKGYRFYEGKLGFDNPITFATAAHLKELTYLRSPAFGLQQAENAYRNLAATGAITDPSGSPYWDEAYSHWAAAALAEFHRVHLLPAETIRALLPAMAGDVRAWLGAYDKDGDSLPERNRPRITGYDLDILSYWYFSGTKLDIEAEPPNLERADFAAFVYANARGVAELARAGGDAGLAAEFDGRADKIRAAVLDQLWDADTEFFYPQRAEDNRRAPIRELHGFFPFTARLVPDEPRYLGALKKFVDPDEFWSRFPPVITSQAHYRKWTWEMDGLSRNIAPHPISMGARTLLQVLKHYRQSAIAPEHFMELMSRYNRLVYPGVNPFDPYWRPNAHEYYSKWEPHQASPRPKPSDISHDFHSMYNCLVVEGVVGLTPRTDAKIEFQPAALRWPHFALHGLRYRGQDLTVVWDQPDGKVRYSGRPEGFSLWIDGKLAFTRAHLGHVLYDPADGTTREVDGPSPE